MAFFICGYGVEAKPLGSQNCREQFWPSDRMGRRPKLMDELSNSRRLHQTYKPPSGGLYVAVYI
ncbi:MAG: hypothetical protein COB23_07115 [Methylophaga sp.]|nr:MAG: hypothetical protein COB23_07115 [Methylophaga sp.]